MAAVGRKKTERKYIYNEKGCKICCTHTSNKGSGYPAIWDANKNKMRKASHVIWEKENKKPFPKDKVALHECDNPYCELWGSGHIRLGTQYENMHDCLDKKRLIFVKGRFAKNALAV